MSGRDAQVLREKLAAHLPDGGWITGVVPLTTGFSNDTYLVEGADLILRLPPYAGAMLDGHDVIAQARIYRELGALADGPPVPGIAALGEDSSILGAPFYAMERVRGEAIHDTSLQPWFTEATDAFRAGICRQWVSARMWQAFATSADCPQLVAQFDRLLAVPAPLSGPPALVHGDTKLSNLMWLDGRISAMLDWEMALNGEPLADLGYMLYGFESAFHGATTPQKQSGMLKRDEVIALWSEVSGRPADGVFWHEIAQIGKIGAIIAEGTNMYNTGRSSDPKLVYFKNNLDYYLGVMKAMLDGGGF